MIKKKITITLTLELDTEEIKPMNPAVWLYRLLNKIDREEAPIKKIKYGKEELDLGETEATRNIYGLKRGEDQLKGYKNKNNEFIKSKKL